jgi:hypothetical protein
LVIPLRSRCARRSKLPLQAAILAGLSRFLDGIGRYFKSEKHSPRPHASAFRTALAVTSSRRIARLKVPGFGTRGTHENARDLAEGRPHRFGTRKAGRRQNPSGGNDWDDAKVISPNQVLEVAVIGKQVRLIRVD